MKTNRLHQGRLTFFLNALAAATIFLRAAAASAQTYSLEVDYLYVLDYGTVTSSPAGINCGLQGSSCSATFPADTLVTLTATPTAGYAFSQWGGPASACGTNPVCAMTMDRNKEVQAYFVKSTQTNYSLTVVKGSAGGTVTSQPAGLACGALTCSGSFPASASVTLTATPTPGWAFAGWAGDASACGTNLDCTVTMSSDKTVYASFVQLYTLTVQELGTGTGRVTSSPAGIDCGSNCVMLVRSNTVVTLTATPDPGSMFERWHEVSGACQSSNVSCSFPVSGNETVGVYFSKILADTACFAQQWLRQFGTPSSDVAYHVASDGSSNHYVVGSTGGALGGSNAGDNDAWLAKYDAAGNRIWVRQIGTPRDDNAFAVATDRDGNIYLAGSTFGSLGGANAGAYDAWLAKYDHTGSQTWITQLGTSGSDSANAIAVDASGFVYVAGETQGALGGAWAGLNDAWLAKYDCCGNALWIRQWGTQRDDGAEGVAVDSSDNVYVAGYLDATSASSQAFLARFDAEGNQQWLRSYAHYVFDAFYAVATDDCGNAIFTGVTDGDFGGPNAGGPLPATSFDAVIGKVDGNGNLVWVRQLGTDTTDLSQAVALDRAGNIYIAGATAGALGGLNAGGDPALNSGVDLWFARFDPNGNLGCIKQIGTSYFWDEAYGVAVDNSYNVYVAGGTAGSLGGDSFGANDAFLVKFAQNPVPSGGDLALSLTGSPNPVSATSNLTYSLTLTNFGPRAFTRVTLTDSLPGNVAFVSATASAGNCTQDAGTVTCFLGTLTNQAAVAVTITVEPTLAGAITNTAGVTANEPDPNLCNHTAQTITMSVPNDSPPVLLRPSWDASGAFPFTLLGIPLRSYDILASTNLTDWSLLGTVVDSNNCGAGRFRYLDLAATNYPRRFYRASLLSP
jgi:uncharacterized repeat protein (TIGR01451 family)